MHFWMQSQWREVRSVLLTSMLKMLKITQGDHVTMTQEKYALNLTSLLFHMSHELVNFPQDTIRNLIGNKKKQMLACLQACVGRTRY